MMLCRVFITALAVMAVVASVETRLATSSLPMLKAALSSPLGMPIRKIRPNISRWNRRSPKECIPTLQSGRSSL